MELDSSAMSVQSHEHSLPVTSREGTVILTQAEVTPGTLLRISGCVDAHVFVAAPLQYCGGAAHGPDCVRGAVISGCLNTTIVLGPCARQVSIEHSERCDITVCGRRIRMRCGGGNAVALTVQKPCQMPTVCRQPEPAICGWRLPRCAPRPIQREDARVAGDAVADGGEPGSSLTVVIPTQLYCLSNPFDKPVSVDIEANGTTAARGGI